MIHIEHTHCMSRCWICAIWCNAAILSCHETWLLNIWYKLQHKYNKAQERQIEIKSLYIHSLYNVNIHGVGLCKQIQPIQTNTHSQPHYNIEPRLHNRLNSFVFMANNWITPAHAVPSTFAMETFVAPPAPYKPSHISFKPPHTPSRRSGLCELASFEVLYTYNFVYCSNIQSRKHYYLCTQRNIYPRCCCYEHNSMVWVAKRKWIGSIGEAIPMRTWASSAYEIIKTYLRFWFIYTL